MPEKKRLIQVEETGARIRKGATRKRLEPMQILSEFQN